MWYQPSRPERTGRGGSMKHRNWLTMFALVSVLALVGAACADDSSTGTTGGGGGGDTAGSDCSADEFGCVEIAAGDPITIATLLAITGDNKNLGLDSQYGAELALDYLDGTFDATPGQLLDHEVSVINEDETCSAEGGQQGATALAANDAIVGVIGTSCSSASLGIADKILSDKGITPISPSATNPALTTEGTHQPFYFRTAHNDRIRPPAGGRRRGGLLGAGAGCDDRRHDPRREPLHAGAHGRVRSELRAAGRHDHVRRGCEQRRQGLQDAADEDRPESSRRDLRAGLQPGVCVDREAEGGDERARERHPAGFGRVLGRHVHGHR